MQARANGFPDKKIHTKWRELHAKARRKESGVSQACSADALLLHLPRERDAWKILQSQFPGQENLAADLSQSITRTGARVDGRLPCITPGSVLAVGAAGRVVTPLEKIMLHGFPIHRMMIPHDIGPAELSSMGGNTMHVQVVAAAILMLQSLVDWSLPAVSAPCQWDFGDELGDKGPSCKKMRAQEGPRSKVHSSALLRKVAQPKKLQS